MLLWFAALMIACPLAIRLVDHLSLRFFWLRTALWIVGYISLVGGTIAAALSRGFDMKFFLYAPAQFFSWPAALAILIGIVCLAASGPTHWQDDDDNFPDDDPFDDDPWGPDFDEARARWERPLVKS